MLDVAERIDSSGLALRVRISDGNEALARKTCGWVHLVQLVSAAFRYYVPYHDGPKPL